jgi:hypothetical protein
MHLCPSDTTGFSLMVHQLPRETLCSCCGQTPQASARGTSTSSLLIAEFLAADGFQDVRLVGRNPRTSADIFAAQFIRGANIPYRLFIEVKRWRQTIGISVINEVLGAFVGERERFGWSAAMIVTVGGFCDFEKWSREELELKGLFLKKRDDLLRYLNGYKQNANGLWLAHPRTDL